jgi:hypothetical protein
MSARRAVGMATAVLAGLLAWSAFGTETNGVTVLEYGRRPRTEHRPAVQKRATPKPIYLTPHAAEILHMSKSGVSDDVLIAYIDNSPWRYEVTSHQLVSLQHAGLSQPVLKAMVKHGQIADARRSSAGGIASRTALYQEGAFYPSSRLNDVSSALGAFGQWFYLPGYGWCWQPAGPAVGSLSDYLYPDNALGWNSPVGFDSGLGGFAGFDGYGSGGHERHEHDGEHEHGNPTPWAGQRLLASATPLSPLNERPAGLPANMPYTPVGALPVAQNSQPWLPLGATSGSFGGSPYLPVGAQPASGSLSPYGIPGVPISPNNGLNPYLPVGGQIPAGNLNPYGIAPSVPQQSMLNGFAQPGFPALPAAPMLSASPMLPGGPFFFGNNQPPFLAYGHGGWPLWPSWPTIPHARYYGVQSGYRGHWGGGGRGGVVRGGGVVRAGGGGHAAGGGGGGHR